MIHPAEYHYSVKMTQLERKSLALFGINLKQVHKSSADPPHWYNAITSHTLNQNTVNRNSQKKIKY